MSVLNGVFDLPWWGYLLVTLGLTHVTIAAVTIFLHRHQAHRALELHPLPSHFFRFWLWLTTGMVTREWAAIHRKHHARCETEEDPHSPQTRGIWKVLLEGAELYRAEARNQDTLARFGYGTPDDWLERHVYRHNLLGILLMLGIDLLLFGPLGLSIWAVQMLWIPFWAAGVINGLGHFWGYRNFASGDASTNLLPWGILIGGEELHNNHHTFATSAKLSNRWYEFDIGWLYIRILAALSLARVKRVAPTPRLGQPRAQVDGQTLDALITHRYDLLARYGRSLAQAYRSELLKFQDRARFEGLKQALASDGRGLPGELRQRLDELLARAPSLATLYVMRQELTALWGRSNASREQVLQQLQEWCRKAETSGIRQLQELSMRLRSYALA
ncbi:fatty acid desaturase [Azovibrio restrictus]|uniref:DesA family fatty acid desaturase n=1 Tax=Azovibrio restrictus TaxID=146938 RepID=UPI0026F05564|nr:fatty acid desaturase [Azovibrio restrictus]MDD3483534.1 fatty acid desaturase [Azovibrio restrictus]